MGSPACQLKALLAQDCYRSNELLPTAFVTLLSQVCDQMEHQAGQIMRLEEGTLEFVSARDIERVSEELEIVKGNLDKRIVTVGAAVKNEAQAREAEISNRFENIDRHFEGLANKMRVTMNQIIEPVEGRCTASETSLTTLEDRVKSIDHAEQSLRESMEKLRKSIPAGYDASMGQFSRRLDGMEASFRKIETDFGQHETSVRQEFTNVKEAEDRLRVDIRNTAIEIDVRQRMMPSTYAKEEDQPMIVNGEVDISPLIRGIFRDSRRLDGFNEKIATTRLECEDLVNAVVELQTNMQQFNHNSHDLAMEDGRMKAMFTSRISFLQTSIVDLDRQLGKLWGFVRRITEACAHSAANSSTGFDQVQSVIAALSSRPLPILIDFSDTCTEIGGLNELVHDHITRFEGDRETYRYAIDDDGKAVDIPEVRVGRIPRRDIERQNIVIPYPEMQSKVQMDAGEVADALVNRSLEELRVNVNDVQGDMQTMQDQFRELMRETTLKLQERVAGESLERIVDKIHRMINQLAKRVDQCEEERALDEARREMVATSRKKGPGIPALPVRSPQVQLNRTAKAVWTDTASSREQSALGRSMPTGRTNKTAAEIQRLIGRVSGS